VQHQVNLTEGLYLDLSTEPDPEGLPWEISISVYRIVMELIQNTIKHAHAQHLYIVLQFKQDKLLLTYRDDGRGLPATPTRGLGLKNLEARVNALGGTYTLTGKKGFECIVSVPVSTNKS
ncbi:MAG: ATP-binding protein, partial [Cyclobacteriaceae bacterium]|nr:ATP-binding protein [Cyclobacteriaceae bacterium]